MSARIRYGAVLIFALALTGSAAAETADNSNERFTMSPTDGGFLRLDKKTGAVSMCAHTGNSWACKPVDDQAIAAPSGELSRLEQENRALKDRVKALEEALETAKPPPAAGPPPPPDGKMDLPTEEQVDQALDYFERVYKKLRDRMKDLDKPLPPAENAPPPDNPPPPPPKGSL